MVSIINFDCDEGRLIEWAGFIRGNALFADAEGRLRLVNEAGTVTDAILHDGLLCATPDPKTNALYCGGEDGLLSRIDGKGHHEIVADFDGKWIDHVAVSVNGLVAGASGRSVSVIKTRGDVRHFTLDRTAEGLAFAPKGARLAISRFGGIELHWINSDAEPQVLEWQGAHTGVFFSPDGSSVISLMQENALHGWRLSDGRHMKMTGYPTKVKSWSWSKKGKWLATSGAPAAILWPFAGKDGPMGQSPKELGSMGQTLVTCVCCHHQEDVVAIGYENGMIMLARIEDGQLVSLKPEGKAAINALNWHLDGKRLAYGGVEGEAGIINIAE